MMIPDQADLGLKGPPIQMRGLKAANKIDQSAQRAAENTFRAVCNT